jgi:hypothetical protein
MASIDDILARAKPRVETATICLAGDLRAEHSRLSAELERVQQASVGKMAGAPEARELAERIQQVEGEMAEAMQEFRFAGISSYALAELQERFPPREGKRESWNASAAEPALVAACAADPAMTEAEAEALRKAIAQGDWDSLVAAAWNATTSRESVPFSVRASVLTAGGAQR